ncbi:MAG: VOC family protein [Pseudomonadota bacterium]
MEFGPATPFFRVTDFSKTLGHYRDGLGFEVRFISDGPDPFFALLGRGNAQIMIKDVGVAPLPNSKAHRDAPWDAFVFVENPQAYLAEIESRDVMTLTPLTSRDDGLTGFEVADPDGHVCFFGRPSD